MNDRLRHSLLSPPPRQPHEARAQLRPAAASSVNTGTLHITSARLFAGNSEVQIEHNGSVYRLKQTSLGKLILTK